MSYTYHQLEFPTKNKLTSLRLSFPAISKQVYFQSDYLTIAGDLYQPQHLDNSPAIVLLHGISIFGRKLPLIQVLAQKFQEMGYTVLAVDCRGFGESEDPLDRNFQDFDFARDVQSAIDFLISQVPINPSQLYVFGHSFGGGVALAAQARDPRIKKLVLLGPTRRGTERFLSAGTQEQERCVGRMRADMELEKPLNFSLVKQISKPLYIENYIDDFSKNVHIPIFLIDAEYEAKEDLEFLRDIYQSMAQPVEYWTVPKTGHRLSTGFLLRWPCYNQQVVETFVTRVDQWLQQ
ncbi:MAG: alpha/beta fold hydrolase [Symploca sp. SIO2B6]|nr:alpha/beta fold hydrolase [Symploca sp. SIO2B6]